MWLPTDGPTDGQLRSPFEKTNIIGYFTKFEISSGKNSPPHPKETKKKLINVTYALYFKMEIYKER